MTHRLDADDYFIHCIQKHCAEAGLNFFLIEPLWVERFYDCLDRGLVWPRVVLNMHSEHHEPKEIFHQLVRLAAQKHCRVIDPPDRALAAFDKAGLHPRLIAAGIHVPFTIIVPGHEVTSFQLEERHLSELETPFVIKPSLGYGRKGVILEATQASDLAKSAEAWPDRNYLLQRRIQPADFQGRLGYFRVFHAFGSIWSCWWNCYTDHYRPVEPSEVTELGLQPLTDITRQMAAVTGMDFFSTEIALTAEGRFVVIDYINDQCHMLSQGADPEKGVPNELVAAVARRLVEGALGLIRA